MSLHGRKDIQFVKLTWSVLHSELTVRILPLYRGIITDGKRTHTHTYTRARGGGLRPIRLSQQVNIKRSVAENVNFE